MMRARYVLSILTASLSLFASAAGQPADDVSKRFAVLNSAGENFSEIRERPDLIEAHRGVYEALEADCLIALGGALQGETPLGLTIFVEDVDEDAVRRRVEADPAVEGGYIALDYRVFFIQRGDLPAVAENCVPA